jgi:hypothetical protein
MYQQTFSLVVVSLLASGAVTGVVTASADNPEATDDLDQNESTTLWSRDADTGPDQSGERFRTRNPNSTLQELSERSDFSFKRPPATAATWTRNDFESLEGGESKTSVYPPGTSLEDHRFVKDAHATVFGVHPSTRAHLDSKDTPLYIAPDGTLRGLIDYRVDIPDGGESENRATDWSLVSHEIESVRLKNDGEVIETVAGTQTPTIEYQLDGMQRATLTLEADIHVRVRKSTTITRGNQTIIRTSYRTSSLTVSGSIETVVYDLTTYTYSAEYPNGESAVAIFQSQPWQGYSLTHDDGVRVRGVWRFYTARDPTWETLVRSSDADRTRIESAAIPVYVHAYPSRIGPRSEPVRNGPEISNTWGRERSSPQSTVGDTVHVGVVEQPYTATHGVAVRSQRENLDSIYITGIVHGVDGTIVEPDSGSHRSVRKSTLTVEVVRQNRTHATVRIRLQDQQTGEPISLTQDSRDSWDIDDTHRGYISVAGQRVRTNDSGVAIVSLNQSGVYTVRYHPGSWLQQNPAYVGDTATVRWHPLGSVSGVVNLLIQVAWWLLPFVVMFYAGRRLVMLLGPLTRERRRL